MEETIEIDGTTVAIRGGHIRADDGRIFVPINLPQPDDNQKLADIPSAI